MSKARKIERIVQPEQVMEGAGVRLRRSIATRTLDYVDPFLLLDHFDSIDPEDYSEGFPMHPHRGIETVTYMLDGVIHHRDSLGNAGSITAGDVQWMTSGSGILHEEMPDPDSERMAGFQLWVNLPAKLKMTKPRYQEILASNIPEVRRDDGAILKVIAGTAEGVTGPVRDIAAEPSYLDVTLPPNTTSTFDIPRGHTAFSYVFEGKGTFGVDGATVVAPSLVVWEDGDFLQATSSASGMRFLLVSAKPLHEPIARYGPFVMNTREEIQEALNDLRGGTFVKKD